MSFAILPNLVSADSAERELTEEIITQSVKNIVKAHNDPNEAIIADSGYTDKDGTKIFYYILPPTVSASRNDNELSIQSVTPISSHTIPQGVRLLYSQSNGNPWTVTTNQVVGMSFTTNQSSATWMEWGHINTDTGADVWLNSGNANPGTGGYSYSGLASATHIRFFIKNGSASNVIVSGSIVF